MSSFTARKAFTFAAILFAGASFSAAEPATTRPAVPLRKAVGDRMLIGCMFSSPLLQDPKYVSLISQNFSVLTGGNELKPDSTQHIKGEFNFTGGDKLAAFAAEHDMKMIGHTLVWHQQSPDWLYMDASKQPLPREQALANMKAHIDAMVGHFKGKVLGWDVVNEAIDDGNGYLRDTPALRAIGPDYIAKAFEFARAADPDVQLYYNDYNIERGAKREKTLRLLRELKDAGVKVDAVGIQGHWLLEQPSAADVDEGIKAFVDAGWKVMITELDIDVLPRAKAGADVSATEASGLDPYKDGLPDDVQEKLARRYGDLFDVFLKYPQITRVTISGVTDASTWLNNWPTKGRTNHPMLWDREFQPKPALQAVIDSFERARSSNR